MKYARPDLNIFTPSMMKKLNTARRRLVHGQKSTNRRSRKKRKTKISLV